MNQEIYFGRWTTAAVALLTFLFLSGGTMDKDAYAQGAKVHRQTALLTVQPSVVFEGHQVSVIIQPLSKSGSFRLSLMTYEGECLDQTEMKSLQPVMTASLEAPDGFKGRLRVLLEWKQESYWNPIADQTVVFIPTLKEKIDQYIQEAESVEQQSDSALTQAAWAVLAWAVRSGAAFSCSCWPGSRVAAVRFRTHATTCSTPVS